METGRIFLLALLSCELNPSIVQHAPLRPPVQAAVVGAPELVLQQAHTRDLFDADWSPDGRTLLTASFDETVKVWDVATGRVRATLTDAMGLVFSVAWSPDGRRFATGSLDGKTRVWDAQTGQVIERLLPPGGWEESPVVDLRWSPDGRQIAAWYGSMVRKTWIWSVDTRQAVTVFPSSNAPGAWSPDGATFLVGTSKLDGGRALSFVDPATGEQKSELPGGTRGVAYSPDGSRIAFGNAEAVDGSAPPSISILDVRTATVVATLPLAAEVLSWGPRGVLVSTLDAILEIDPTNGAQRWTVPAPVGRGWASPDGRWVATPGDTGRLEIRDTSNGVVTSTWGEPPAPTAVTFAFDWTADGRTLAVGQKPGDVDLWDLATGERRRFEGSAVVNIRFSPDGRTLASLDTQGWVGIWDPATLQTTHVFDPHDPEGFALAWSPDGTTLASAGKGKVHLWDVAGQVERATLRQGETRVMALAWSADGSLLAVGDEAGVVKIWDVARRRARATIRPQDPWIWSLAFSPDGSTLATGSGRIFDQGTLALWEVGGGTLRSTLQRSKKAEMFRSRDEGPFTAVAWSPDGSSLASGRMDGEVRIWQPGAGTSRVVIAPSERVGGLTRLAWSPDGRTLAAGGGPEVVLRHGEESVSLRSFTTGDRRSVLAHDRKGNFAGDDDAFGRVVFRIGPDLRTADLVTADDLFEAFHHPNLVPDFLAGRPIANAQASGGVGLAPEVVLEAPTGAVQTERIPIRVRAVDRGGGVGEIRVYVNGARADEGRGGGFSDGPAGGGGAPGERRLEVLLSPGENVIEAEAYGAVGRVRSRRVSVRVTFGDASAVRPDLYLLAVSIDDYADPAQHLQYTNADAAGFVQAMQAQAPRLYGNVRVLALQDAQATREAMGSALQQMGAAMRPSDVFVLYAAGHGVTLACPGEAAAGYRFLTHRASMRAEATVCSEGISSALLSQALRAMPARKKLLVLDTCQAGAAAAEVGLAVRGAEDVDAIKRLARAEGVAVVAAATAQQYAGEVPSLGHGIFTYALLQGLSGQAARQGQNAVTVFDLLSYLTNQVAALSQQHFQRPQYPVTSLQGQDFPIAIN